MATARWIRSISESLSAIASALACAEACCFCSSSRRSINSSSESSKLD
ncbi:Uncharacterised protein [Mycobacteroides abscessus subsp. abscessus]|nr:Uncharacterised protein [Mycobacteroides abscessus subsp. abscessus]